MWVMLMDIDVINDLIQEEYEVVNSNETISKIVPMLEKLDKDKANSVVVEEDGNIIGVIREKDLIRGSVMVNPHETKIKSFVVKSGVLNQSELTTEKVARRFVEDSTPFVMVRMKDKVGLIYINDFLNALKKDIEKMGVKEVMSSDIITIQDYASAAKALSTMRRFGIDRLIVQNDEHKAIGIVTGKDIIDRIVSPRKDPRMGGGSGEKDKTLSIMVDSIMSSPLITVNRNEKISKVLDLMVSNKISSVVVTRDGIPEGIVVKKDILENYLKGKATTEYSFQLITKDIELDDFEKQEIIKDLEKFMNKFKDFLKESVLFVTIKRHKENFRGLPLIHVRLRLSSERGVFFVTGESWGVEFALNATLKKLEREVLQQKEILIDKRMERKFYEEIF